MPPYWPRGFHADLVLWRHRQPHQTPIEIVLGGAEFMVAVLLVDHDQVKLTDAERASRCLCRQL